MAYRNRPALMLLMIFLGGLLLLFTPEPSSDGAYYYEFARSALVDGDLSFWNEREHHTWRYVPVIRSFVPGSDARPGYEPNIFSIGPALAWLPAYGAALAAESVAARLAGEPPPDGYGLVSRFAAGWVSLAAGLAALLLTLELLKKVADPGDNLAATALVFLGSMVPAFCFVTPCFSHAVSLLATVVFLLAWLRQGPGREADIREQALLGAAVGAMTLARWQNAFLALLPALDFAAGMIREAHGRRWRAAGRRVLAGCAMAGAALVVVSPQLLVTRTIYGAWMVDPQGEGGMAWLRPRLYLVLFNDMKGLFTVNPLLLVGALGLPLVFLRARRLGWGLSALFLLHLYVNSIRRDWAGVGFGMRRFSECLPAFTAGFAALLWGLRRWRRLRLGLLGLAGAAAVWNGLLMAQYYLSELGAPWHQLPLRTWLTRQFTLAPALLSELVGRSLAVSSLRAGSTQAVKGLLLLTAGALALGWLTRRLEPPRRAPTARKRELLLAGCLLTALLLDGWLLGAARDVRQLEVIDLAGDLRQPDVIRVALRRGTPFVGQRSGVTLGAFGGEQTLRNPGYDRNRFLAQGVLSEERNPLVLPPRRELRLPLPPGEPVVALEVVSWLEGLSDRAGQPVAQLELRSPAGTIRSWILRSGHQTAPRRYPRRREDRTGAVLARSWLEPDGSGRSAAWYCRLPLDRPMAATELVIRPRPGHPGLHLSGLALERAGPEG